RYETGASSRTSTRSGARDGRPQPTWGWGRLKDGALRR
ncbi:phage DNA packaging protein J, partial [Allokutzneria sp. NRRL B-24872]